MRTQTPSHAAIVVLVALLLAGCERGVFLPWECSDPALVEGEWDPRLPDQYGVKITDGLDHHRVAEELEVDPGIEVRQVFDVIPWIWVTMDPVQREILRCDARVVLVSHSELIEQSK